MRPPLIGPRNYVISVVRGENPTEDDFLLDTSPWVYFDYRLAKWPYLIDWPELWVDKVHDSVGGA